MMLDDHKTTANEDEKNLPSCIFGKQMLVKCKLL